MRYACLQIAVAAYPNESLEDVFAIAEKYMGFITGDY